MPCTFGALVQGPNITENYLAGLAIDGSADVTITNGTFADNWGGYWGGGGMVVQGNAVVRVEMSSFTGHSRARDDSEEKLAGRQSRQGTIMCGTAFLH